jgi:eukaryotic-like serine/threonine-protein kinase
MVGEITAPAVRMTSSVIHDVPKWQRVNALLQRGLALPVAERETWLGRIADQQADLMPLLRALLARATTESDAFMARPADSVWAEAISDTGCLTVGQQVGPYRLVRELGSGGMGTVWLAERADRVLQRQVALKLPRYGWARGVAERLQQERDALATLEHRHIARLYDAGMTAEGRPYLAMEFVDGAPIDVFAAKHSLPVRARLQLFQQVTQAVDFAHRRLIVHRDLKPSNILVTHGGEVRLLDFGAAKLLQDSGAAESALTREAGRAMSPDYASPEQIRGEPITVATDVYSLGVVLFELLTGTRPYRLERQSSAALEAAIVDAEVPTPSSTVAHDPKLCRELRGDLDNIITKALKKSTQQRYTTVRELADDLQRWLDHEPVRARGDGLAYRVRKFVRRNRVAVAATSLVVSALVVATAVTSIEMFEARRQRDEARLQAKRAEAQERFADMVMEQTGPGGRALTHEEMLDRSVQLLEEQYSNDPRFIARAMISISGRYMDLGYTGKELATLERAETIARQLHDPVLLLSVQCSTVETELAQGSFGRATARMSEARALLAHTDNVPMAERIDCIHAEATLADARGDHSAAVERINQAIALQEQLDRTDLAYRSLLSHAQVLYLHAGRPRDAWAVIEKTLTVLQTTDAQNNQARSGALHNQAMALLQMGEVNAALGREKEANALISSEDSGVPAHPVMANVIGRLLTRMNRVEEAEVWAERAVASARGGGNLGAEVFALAALAEAEERRGRHERAASLARDAAALLEPKSDPRLRASVAYARGLLALSRNDLQEAQTSAASLLEAIGYPDPLKVRTFQSADLNLLLAARIALAAGNLADATRLSTQALELATGLARDPHRSATVGEAQLVLARAREAQHDRNGARETIRDAARALGAGLSPDHPLALEAAALEARL